MSSVGESVEIFSFPQSSKGSDFERFDSHPIFRRRYIISTPVVKRVFLILQERVKYRRTGCYLYGTPRTGKTRCANAMDVLLQKSFPKLFILSFDADRCSTKSVFISRMLDSFGLIHPKRSTVSESMNLVLAHIVTQVSERCGDQFLMIIDEMQFLSENEYIQLLSLHNRLDRLGISMTTVGFAQPEINDQRTGLFATNSHQLIARFLAEPIAFVGCDGPETLKDILHCYDNDLVYPVDTKCSYTKYFVPTAFDSGFRLENFVELLWATFETAVRPARRDIPMEHLTRTIESILIRSHDLDCESYQLDSKFVARCVTDSGLEEFTRLFLNGTSD